MRFLSIRQLFTKERRWFWYRIDLGANVSKSELGKAKTAAVGHKDGVLPNLRYTEQNPEWVLLYSHIQAGQIRPEDIRHMHRSDLEYLAGMNDGPPGLGPIEAAKLCENVARASAELQRRNEIRIGVIGSVVGAIIGAAATILSGKL